MKTISLLLSGFILFSINVFGQSDETKNFVILKDGSIKHHDNIWLKNYGVYSNSKGKEIYPYDDFKFVNAENGFFANTSYVRKRKAPFIAKRTIGGEVNLFESQIISVSGGYVSGASEGSLLRPKAYYNYFNTGYDDLMRIDYKKLNGLFASNAESIDYLNKYQKSYTTAKRLSTTATVMQYSAFALFGFTLINKMYINEADGPKDFMKSFILPFSMSISGSIIGMIANPYYAKANEHLREAFMSYNGIE